MLFSTEIFIFIGLFAQQNAVFALNFKASSGVAFEAWQPNGQCPPNTLVKAVRLEVASRGGLRAGSRRVSVEIDPVGYSDENGLTYLEILCANQTVYDKSVPTKSIYHLDDQYSSLTCPGNTYASGFQLFFTKERLPNGKPKSNVWYLGPHAFVNASTSSLHLHCGRSFADKAAAARFYAVTTNAPEVEADVSNECPQSSGNDQETLLCKIDTNKREWNDRDTYTLKENIDHKCCFTDPLVCKGMTDFPVVIKCDNTYGTSPANCQFPNNVGVVPYTHPTFSSTDSEFGQEPGAPNFSLLAAYSRSQLNFTLVENQVAMVNSFGYQEPFNTVIPPYVRSGLKLRFTSSLSFKVAPGKVGRVRRLRGICDGQPFAIETSIYETKQLSPN